jgi:hypothetical protein
MNILYVTTFNEKLYTQSGREMLRSFLAHVSVGRMLVCYEDDVFARPDFSLETEFGPGAADRLILHDMTADPFMTAWLDANAADIPEMYGGRAGADHPIVRQFEAKEGQYWANHRASRYFRKVVALHRALGLFTGLESESESDPEPGRDGAYDIIFVVDCDCLFKADIPEEIISADLFSNDTGMFFYWGKYRRHIQRGPETGFTGFARANGGFAFAQKICGCFESQDFRRFTYWDDGYVIGQLIDEERGGAGSDCPCRCRDLVEKSNRRTTRVMEIENQPLFGRIHHFKNRHQTSV